MQVNPTLSQLNRALPLPMVPAFSRRMPIPILQNGKDWVMFSATTANFRNQDLTGPNFNRVLVVKNLQGADFTNAVFSAPEFNGKSLNGAIFNNARLKKTNFTAAILEDAKFVGPGTELTEAYLDWVRLSRCNFTQAKMPGVSIASAKGGEVVFDEADLRGADITDSEFPRASFKKADLSRADLRGSHFNVPELDNIPFYKRVEAIRKTGSSFAEARMHGTDLTGASLVGADMKGARLAATATAPAAIIYNTRFQYADMSGADLSGATIERSNLYHVDFTDALLIGTDFSRVKSPKGKTYPLYGVNWTNAIAHGARFNNLDLEEAEFNGTQLQGAHFDGASLHGADLSTALIDDATTWSGAKYSGRTRFPQGFDPQAHGMIFEPRFRDRLPFNRGNEAEPPPDGLETRPPKE